VAISLVVTPTAKERQIMKTLINKFRNRNNKQYPKQYDIRFGFQNDVKKKNDTPKSSPKLTSKQWAILQEIADREQWEVEIKDSFSLKEFFIWLTVILIIFFGALGFIIL
jgi:hypothetical protein